jgi:uncharacterized protein
MLDEIQRSLLQRGWIRFAVTMVAAFAGAALAAALDIVAGWLIGALVAVLIFGRIGYPVHVPMAVRSVALGFSGIMTGAAVRVGGGYGSAEYAVSLIALVLFTAAVLAVSHYGHRLFWQVDNKTAFFSAWPGNMLLALVAAREHNADVDRVVIVQSMRIFILVVLIPLLISAFHPMVASQQGRLDGDFFIAVLVAAVCVLVASRLRIVAGEMFFTAIAIGVLSYTGWLDISVPSIALHTFQVVVGAFIALNLARCSPGSFRSALGPSVAVAAIGGIMTFVFAIPLSWFLEISPAAAILAFAPGGAEPMILLSPVFGVDPGYVGIHHTVRLAGLTLAFPLIAKLSSRR